MCLRSSKEASKAGEESQQVNGVGQPMCASLQALVIRTVLRMYSEMGANGRLRREMTDL